jgi:hypothetical protein
MRILKEDTAVLALDIQSRLFPVIDNNEDLLEKMKRLFMGMNVLEIPYLVTEQYSKALGNTLDELQEIIGENYRPIEKMAFSCMGEPKFVEELKRLGKKNIIIAGIESHVCVLQTVVDLIAEGYNPIVVADAVSSRSKNDKKFAIKRMIKEGATITTYESILFELQQVSGTDTFKAISKIVK